MQQSLNPDKKAISPKLIQEIAQALHNIRGWGSVEIFIQDYNVVQITERNIIKTKHLNGSGKIGKVSQQFAS